MMNERIKELAKQAAARDDDCCYAWDTPYTEKFARLLILECAKFLDEHSGSDEGNNVWYPEPEELLNHFGVEE